MDAKATERIFCLLRLRHTNKQPKITLSDAFGVGRIGPPARYDLTQTSPVTSELRSLVDDLRVREVSYVLSPMYNVSVGAVDSSTPLVTPLLYPRRVVNPRAYSVRTRLDTTPSLGSWSLLALALCPFIIYASSCERFAPPSDARVVSHDQPEPHALPHGFDNHQGAPSVRWLSNVDLRDPVQPLLRM